MRDQACNGADCQSNPHLALGPAQLSKVKGIALFILSIFGNNNGKDWWPTPIQHVAVVRVMHSLARKFD